MPHLPSSVDTSKSNIKSKSKLWLNVTLTKGKKRVTFGIALDYFLKSGNAQQKKFIEAQMEKSAGIHELEGWNQLVQLNIVGDDEDDDDDWS